MRIFISNRNVFGVRRFGVAALLLFPVCVLGLAGVTTLTGCSGSHHDSSVPDNALVVTPSSATVVVGGTQTFVASGDYTASGVIWAVKEGSTGGTITSAGVYTAPATAGTYHVVATSVSHPNYLLTVTVTVTSGTTTPAVSIAISPTTATVSTGATQSFGVTVSNTDNTAVTWSIQEGTAGGSITTTGVYTAPTTAGTYHVVATSVADTTKTAVATITVQTAAVVSVSLNPTSATLVTGGTQTFAASVANASDTSVTWSVQEGSSGGTITSAGVYTAPSTAGTYHVVATSVADSSKSATATVTVTTTTSATGSGTVIVN